MKKIAIYPGSFDPPTYGHLDVIKRAKEFFDLLVIAITTPTHKNCFFSLEEREKMMQGIVHGMKGVQVETFHGLLVDYACGKKARAIIRGLRAVSDFEYELQMALTNRKLNPRLDTLFLTPDEKYIYLSSSMVKEIFFRGGKVGCFVPPLVEQSLKKRIKNT